MALLPGQDVTALGDDDFFGYGVDAGTGTLAAIEALSRWDYEQIEEAFIPAQIPADSIEAVIAAVVDERTAANVYVVGSGWGDGVYATYVGRAEDGRIVGFVTDFRVIPLDPHGNASDTYAVWASLESRTQSAGPPTGRVDTAGHWPRGVVGLPGEDEGAQIKVTDCPRRIALHL
jgi:hypothetical protein